ncbi:MAG: BspA family leucine-rich repeat surface protein, partial [Spirochaetales bacterium]|nr:BspA family leucine-rich repeat surface protein [Spirochaetales bacterium]
MSHMFEKCAKLTSIDVSNFVADKVEDASYMFAGCSALISLDASKMTMPAVKDVSYMFNKCSTLQHLNLSEMTAVKAVNTKSMFYGCSALSKLYINRFAPETIEKQTSKQYSTMFTSVPSSVTVWYNFFLADCIKNQIPGTKVETNNPAKAIYATDETGENVLLFIYLDEDIKTGMTSSLKGRNFTYTNMKINSFWKEKDVTNQTANQPAWKNIIKSVDKVIIDPSFTRPVASVKGWFENGSRIKSIQGLANLNTSKCKSFERMFNGCSSLQSLDVSTFDAKRVTDMTQMFMNCKSLETLKLKDEQGNGLQTASSLTSMKYMFYNCMKLQTLEFGSKFRSYANTSLEGMFFGCKNLKTINRPFMGKNMSYLYDGCESLETVMTTDETGSENNDAFKGTGVTNMECMFRKCKSLKKIDLKDFNPKDAVNTSQMFYGCSALEDLDLSSFMAPASASYSCENMFYGVDKDCYIFLPSKTSDKIYPAQLTEDTYPNLIIIGSTQVLLCGT